MITAKELEIFEKKIKAEHNIKQGSKILADMVQRVKTSTNQKNNIDAWSDYGAWDNWDRG